MNGVVADTTAAIAGFNSCAIDSLWCGIVAKSISGEKRPLGTDSNAPPKKRKNKNNFLPTPLGMPMETQVNMMGVVATEVQEANVEKQVSKKTKEIAAQEKLLADIQAFQTKISKPRSHSRIGR